MEYMSREDYCEENCGKENREGYKTCKNCSMLNVPSADVQPVKHGKWIDIHEWCKMHNSKPSGIGFYHWCSNCGKCVNHRSNYCGECGAKMDEEQHE